MEQTTNPVTIVIAMIIRTEIRISTMGLDSLLAWVMLIVTVSISTVCGDTILTVIVSDKDIFTEAIRFFDSMIVKGNGVFDILILVVEVGVMINNVSYTKIDGN